jgi:hypothetical protein
MTIVRCPELFKTAAKQSLLLDKYKIANILLEALASITESDLSQDSTLAEMSGIICLQHLSIIDIGKSKVFVACENSPGHECVENSLILFRCARPVKRKGKMKKMTTRREMNRDGWVLPKRNVPWDYFDKKEVTPRASHVRTRRRSKAVTIRRLTEKIKTLRSEMDFSDKFITHLNAALEYAIKNKVALEVSIESGLLELLKEEAGDDCNLAKAKAKQLVDSVAGSMKNHVRPLKGHKNWFRYSLYPVGLPMNLYLQSGTSAYDQMHTDNVVIMPCSGYLAKVKQSQILWLVTVP